MLTVEEVWGISIGTSNPFNTTTTMYDLINFLSRCHPVLLVLNCENYYWTDYTSGTDIVMQDTYSIGINATWSVELVRQSVPCHLAYPARSTRTSY